MKRMPGRHSHHYRLRRARLLVDLVSYLGTIALLPALMLGGISDVWNAIWDKTIGVAENVVNYVKSALETFWNWLWETAIYPIYQAIRGAVGAVVSTLNQFMKDVGSTFWDTWGRITSGISTAIGWASENILYWYHQAEGLVNSAAGWLGGQVSDLWSNVRGMADTIYHSLIEPIWHHLESLPGWIMDNLVTPAIHALGDIAGMAWRAVQPILQPYIDWIDGIKNTIGTAWDMVVKLWNALWPIVSNPVGWLEDHLRKAVGDGRNPLVRAIHDAMAQNLDGIEKWIVSILG